MSVSLYGNALTNLANSTYLKTKRAVGAFCFFGAGDGNRTHVTSLEGWNSTIELHPQATLFIIADDGAFVNTCKLQIENSSK